jgi:hypothetical protein
MTDTTWIVENKSKRPPQPLTTEFMEHNQLDPVFEGARPSLTPPYQTIVDDGVEQVDGKWTTKYKVGPVFTEYKDKGGKTVTISEQTTTHKASVDARVAESNRNQRNVLLAETDYFGLSDVTMTDNMKTYRQALRDLPKHSKWPHLTDSDWPTKP